MSSKSSKSTTYKAYSKTALDWFLANALFNEIEDGDYRSIKELIEKKGADPNVIIPEKGIAPIHLVIGLDDQNFCYNTLKLFLSHSGDPNSRSSDGMTPVHIAAVWGRTEILKLLLQHGGDPWILDNENNNAFSYAHEEQHWETWRFLDDYKNSIIHEKPDKDRYRLKLECVKIYKNDLCAEYKADPVSSTCRSTQTLESFPGEIIVNFTENIQIPQLELNKDFRSPVSELAKDDNDDTPGPSGARSLRCNGDQLFDMNFDELPEDQKIRAIRMVKLHRQRTDYIEYNPHVEGYDADADLSKSSIEEQNKDIGYSSGSQSPTGQNSASFSSIFKKNSRSAGLLNSGKDWMVNITQRKKIRSNLNKLHESCSERLRLNVFTRRTNSCHERGNTTVISDETVENFEKLSVSDCRKTKVSHYSVTKQLKRVSSDFNRKLSLVFGNSKHRSDMERRSIDESEIYVNRSCARSAGEINGMNESLKEDRLSERDVSMNENQRFRASRSETVLSNIPDYEVRNSFSNPTVSKRCSTEVRTTDDGSPVRSTNDNKSYSVNDESDKNKYEFDMRMQRFLDEVMTEDESKSSQNLEHGLHTCRTSMETTTDTNKSRISLSDNFFSCASVEESRTSDLNKCRIVDYSYTKNYPRMSRMDEVNGNCDGTDRFFKKYGSTDESRKSSNDFFSCASVEESETSDQNKCRIVDYSYTKDYPRMSRTDEVNGNCDVADGILKKYGWSVSDTSRDDIVVINEFDTSEDGPGFSNEMCGVVNSTPTRLPATSESNCVNFNGIPKIPSTNINDISKITCSNFNDSLIDSYSNSHISDSTSVSASVGDSIELFESNIKESDSNGNIDKSNVYDDVYETAAKSTSLNDSEVCNESLKIPNRLDALSSSENVHELSENLPETSDNLLKLSKDISGNVDMEVSISEEYLYTDDDDGIQLVEECHLPALKRSSSESSAVLADNLKINGKSNCGTTDESESAVSSVEMAYETDELRRELRDYGLMAGPITKGTKRVYLRKLKRFRRRPRPSPQLISSRPQYCVELERILLLDEDIIQKWSHLETEMCNPFQTPDVNKRWREGISKASFTYLLLDPRLTQNLPARSIKMTSRERFLCFLSAIFYIGRGKRSRPYSHLYEALTTWNRTKYPSSKKVLKILDIWNSGQGVICLHVFQNVIPVEAMTREASMIDAMGLKSLTNEKLGDYYAVACEWTLRKRQQLGIVLLAKALNVFLAEGERQLRPPDISR